MARFNPDMFHDYVVAHGYGAPTDDGMKAGESLVQASCGDYASAAFEVVFLGLTTEPE